MRFSLLITLIAFSFLGCQTLSRGSKSANTTAKKTNSAVIAKSSDKNSVKQSTAKQSKANPALAQKSIYEELTGKKGLAGKEAPARILDMARDSKWKRDYVTALKRYNTIIVKYPKSKEVRQAYLDKAELYKEMGLLEQSKYNLQKAKQ